MQPFVPEASYYVFEDVNDIRGDASASCQYAIFYTFNGNAITTIDLQHCRFTGADEWLDPKAPKPQPVRCVIDYWEGRTWGDVRIQGLPGWFICFKDKNFNQIKSYRYNKETHEIIVPNVRACK